jgi:hypothetical protein
MKFSEALEAVMQGKRVRRQTWQRLHPDRAGAWLELVYPAVPDGRQVEPELMMCFPGEGDVLRSFSGSSALLLADDWEILEEPVEGKGRMVTFMQVTGWVIIAVAFGYLPFGIRRLRRASRRDQIRNQLGKRR